MGQLAVGNKITEVIVPR